MASRSGVVWRGERARELDAIERAHGATRGTQQDAARQIVHAYVLLLSSQFQGFCRDLFKETLDAWLQATHAPSSRRT